jgi:hypothetical protein
MKLASPLYCDNDDRCIAYPEGNSIWCIVYKSSGWESSVAQGWDRLEWEDTTTSISGTVHFTSVYCVYLYHQQVKAVCFKFFMEQCETLKAYIN